MANDVLISDTVRQNKTHEIRTIKKEIDCYCCGMLGGDPQNCDCFEKHQHLDGYRSKKFQDYLTNGKLNGFGPCLLCNGKGRRIATRESKRHILPCIGGPFAGMRKIPEAAENYYSFNRGDRDETLPKAVLLHKSLFPEGEK